MKVYFLDYGWLEGDINWMVALKNYATKTNKSVSSVWTKFPEYGVLVELQGQYILYDTGSNPSDYDRSNRFPFYYKNKQGILNQLSLLGLTPNDIKTVVLSHLHDDHAGNIHLFPHAEIYIDISEYEFYANPDNNMKIYDCLKKMKYIRLVDKDIQLNKYIQLKRLPGHSHGLLGMLFHMKDELWFIVSDAINTIDNYSIPPKAAVGLFDERVYFQTIEEIRKIEKDENAKIFFGHDFNQFRQLNICPEYYEFEECEDV